jgi:hypothetical protein
MSTALHIVKPFDRFPFVECPGCTIAMTLKELDPAHPPSTLYHAVYH